MANRLDRDPPSLYIDRDFESFGEMRRGSADSIRASRLCVPATQAGYKTAAYLSQHTESFLTNGSRPYNRYERRTIAYAGRGAGLSGWNRGSGVFGGDRGALRFHRSHSATLQLRAPEACPKGCGAALPRAGKWLFAPTAHAARQTGL